jgi:hypothetical protein
LHDRCSSCTRIPDSLVRTSSQTEPVDLDPDPDIAASIQSHLRDSAVLHTPTIIASSSGG